MPRKAVHEGGETLLYHPVLLCVSIPRAKIFGALGEWWQ
jgi:hypothetical protein